MIRMSLIALALAAIAGVAPAIAQDAQPLTLLKTVPITDVTDKHDFDHFAVDLAHDQLFVSSEGHHSVEVFNLLTGAHLRTIMSGLKTPHTLAFVQDKNELFVADGGDASVKVFEGTTDHQIAKIPLRPGPDAGVYDSATRLFYVANGGKVDNSETSTLSAIDVDSLREVRRIPFRSSNLESMVIDHATQTLYVNIRDKKQIGLLDLRTGKLRAVWSVPGMQLNTPMAYDQADHRLFVGGRKPGILYVLDSRDGNVIAKLPCVDTEDDMTYDAPHRMIYLTGADGLDVFRQNDPDHYTKVEHVDTLGGKTSEYVPSVARFFVPHTRKSAAASGLQVFQVNE
jgi:DNA-binding beta-propeller fold protein YncE